MYDLKALLHFEKKFPYRSLDNIRYVVSEKIITLVLSQKSDNLRVVEEKLTTMFWKF
ncbi:hypothetical protein [Desulfosporosinus shakirovi]|uniref:hypothetical protein n=1 Tax=Desulfosporosinus shakirovi TaxID=2885154 RepID=UPI001E39A546|nr:hypothetical protein [Desulfosporosinus sp. SRJS8]MCB8814520.1 hypothetical protein [Desulfosporosinus sp. SRJS8]